jgi:hypothetical protein
MAMCAREVASAAFKFSQDAIAPYFIELPELAVKNCFVIECLLDHVGSPMPRKITVSNAQQVQ